MTDEIKFNSPEVIKASMKNAEKEIEELRKKAISYEEGLVYLEDCMVKKVEYKTKERRTDNGIYGPAGKSWVTGHDYTSIIEIEPNQGVQTIVYEGAHVDAKKGGKIKAKIFKAEKKYFANNEEIYVPREFHAKEDAAEIITKSRTYSKSV